MVKSYELELELVKEEIPVEEKITKNVISWTFKNFKFLLLPGSRLDDLTQRELEFERIRGKRKFIRRFKSVLTITGIVIVFLMLTLAVFCHWISPYNIDYVTHSHPGAWSQPSPLHPLGQSEMGYDVLSRLIFGARSSLSAALPSIMLSVLGGVMIGVTAAYYRGWVDSLLMRICDILLAFPGLILALVIIAIVGQQIQYILIVWGILGIPFYARLIRGNVLQARELPYIQAAKVAGAGNGRIMFRHILPNVVQPIIVSVTFNIGGWILGLAALSYLGFSDPNMIEWGNDINFARTNLYSAPWASLWPGFMILITVLGFMLLGDGLRDALDPRLKNL
ncbi:MAG: ABC transporter permease [Candidatus Hermodarchaeota archaeon]